MRKAGLVRLGACHALSHCFTDLPAKGVVIVGIRGRGMNFKKFNRLMICAGVCAVVVSVAVAAFTPRAVTAQGRTPYTTINCTIKTATESSARMNGRCRISTRSTKTRAAF